jgi:hypothetical protein
MKKITLTALAIVIALSGNAEAKNRKYHSDSRVEPIDKPLYNDNYNRDQYAVSVGDPRIVYHEIGTSGAQNGNTILAFYNEPIRSSRPYEIRYDYRSMR